MKNTFVFVAIIALVLAACGDGDGNGNSGNGNGTSTTTLTIQNESFSDLINVKWSGELFADNGDTLRISGSVKKNVQPGSAYVFFSRKSNPLTARTRELVIVEAGKDNIFKLLDNTLVVDETDHSNTGTFKDLTSRPGRPDRPTVKVEDSTIQISWTAVEGADFYRIYYSATTTRPETPAKETAETSITINDLTNEVTYYVWLQAVNDKGPSEVSERVQATPTGKATISIKNLSDSWLMAVSLGELEFKPINTQKPYGIEGYPGDPDYFWLGDSSHKIETGENISGYIFFVLHLVWRDANNEWGAAARPCRTRDLVVVNRGEVVEFVFTDDTMVVEVGNSSNVKTLKDMEAYFISTMD
jgi:hypothetical protein